MKKEQETRFGDICSHCGNEKALHRCDFCKPNQEYCECSQYNDYGGIKCGNCGKYIKSTQPQVSKKLTKKKFKELVKRIAKEY